MWREIPEHPIGNELYGTPNMNHLPNQKFNHPTVQYNKTRP